ncbi:nucleoside 2-deoxyribosyltransferase [Rhizosaccharibacter radicis]|uniref:Nucleoside 2-deoxyribosyltransferase n=1 Tax=Rhizosaccharibacter radicis TaxID=2782605 RepID=A0ABT1VVT5_9PROT|nr:nucleoside 2-deoxyribosyltransferase [Acetobacteraceae bacterium KSS12]
MSGRPWIYLAGPDVFAPDVEARAARLKAWCMEHGAEGLFPLDNLLPDGPDLPERIREANMAMIRRADVLVANMTPFRGVSMDPGTAYEMGAAAALGKIVVGYTTDARSYESRISAAFPVRDAGGVLRDGDGMAVERFARPLADNLMMACGLDGMTHSPEDAIRMVVHVWRGRQPVRTTPGSG